MFAPETWLSKYDDWTLSNFSLFAPLISTFSFVTGYILCALYMKKAFKYNTPDIRLENYLSKPPLIYKNYTYMALTLLILGTLCGLSYYKEMPPTIKAVVELVSGNQIEEVRGIVSSGRRDLTKSHIFGAKYRGQGVLKRFTHVIWEYGTLLAILMAAVGRKKKWYILVALYIIGAFIFIGGTGERGPILWLIVMMLVSLSYVLKFRIKSMVLFAALIFFLFGLITILSPRYSLSGSKIHNLLSLTKSITSRIILGGKRNNVRIMNYIDEGILRHTYGEEHLNIARNVLPGIHRSPLANKIAVIAKGETTTYFSPTYLGIVYIDFRVLGLFLIYFIMGVLVVIIFNKALLLPKRLENIVFLSLLGFTLGRMQNTAGLVIFLSKMGPICVIHGFVLALQNILSVKPRLEKDNRAFHLKYS